MKGKNKYIVRPNRYERKEPSRDSRKIYIYCEGNRREYDYFQFFCGLSSNVNIIPSLKKFVDAMVPGGFDSRKHPARIAVAIDNAAAEYEEDNAAPAMYCTEVFKLGKEILPFVKDVL